MAPAGITRKTITISCESCGRNFRVRLDEGWKFLCKTCYKEKYIPILKHKYKVSDLRGKFNEINEPAAAIEREELGRYVRRLMEENDSIQFV